MPGNIRVAVLEAVDLPAAVTAGKSVAVKVAVGKKEFQTTAVDAEDGRTQPWNSEFLFPVLNLRDNLVVAIMDSKGDVVARAELETPGIVQKGFQDEFIALKAGGRIHVKVSFVLSEEERRKIDAMRLAAIRRKKGFSQPNKSRHAPVSNVKITEITSEDTVDSDGVKEKEEAALPSPNEIKAPISEKPPAAKSLVEPELKPVPAWKPSIPLKLEKTEKVNKKPPQPSLRRTKEEERGTSEESGSNKVLGFKWLSGKLRSDQSKAAEGGRWLEDLKLKNRNDKLRDAKAARADEWIKKLDKQLPHGDAEVKTSPPENMFREEGRRLKQHLQEEEKKVLTLGQKSEPREDISVKTVKQKLEDWKVKESGPWRRSSKVQHASPPDSDQQPARWSLKGRRRSSDTAREESVSVNVTIEQPELMAAADRMWASNQYSEDDPSPSMTPETRKKSSGGVKGFMKQVFSGAAAVAGSFILWSRKGSSKLKKKERLHVVREGETLSSIVPDEWDDPDSEFYRLNPEVRDRHFIYPGQQLRLPG